MCLFTVPIFTLYFRIFLTILFNLFNLILFILHRISIFVVRFWHSHFTSSLDKVDALFMYWQNLTWRRRSLDKLGRMLREVTIDPAMLTYLDLATSDASDPAQPPNEN